jgi:4'-phosphopantetheinyl transferase
MPTCLPVRATDGIVHIWRADLAAAEDGLEDLLSADELARAACILPRRRRILWTRSRGVLRALLACYVDRDPRALRFVLGPHGKPALLGGSGAGAGNVADLRFNLSHSDTIALYAVTAGRAVGIDIELPHARQIDEAAIAARVLGREQALRLTALDPQARTREFLRAWVAHEAVVKCRGAGLGTSSEDTADDPWSAELDVGPPAIAAVAVEGGRCELRHFEWPGYGPTAPVSARRAGFAMKAPPRYPNGSLSPSQI